ncbi:MAG TPA: DUF3108 domain-containing protein [Thermoanaerobaculia bacterium]
MHPMLALILATLCPPQHLPPMKLTPGEALTFKLDVVGADVGTFEVRTEAPPSSEKRAAIQLSSRAKTNAFMATNVGRYDVYATALVSRDFTPLRYREDVDENEVHRGTEMVFPPEGGKLAVKATKNGEPEPYTLDADPDVRDVISTLYILRMLPPNQEVCLELFAGKKIWKVTGKMGGKETIDTPLGRFTTLRFDGEAVLATDPRIKRPALMWVTDDARRLPISGIAETRGKTIRAQLISAPGLRRAARK